MNVRIGSDRGRAPPGRPPPRSARARFRTLRFSIRSDLPGLLRRARSHWRKRGAAHVLRLIARRLVDPILSLPPDPTPLTSAALARQRFPEVVPLLLRALPSNARAPRRINVVTDTISPPDLFGGVATSLILGALLAERHALELRVITRVTPPDLRHVAHVLGVAGVALPAHVTSTFAPYRHPELAVEGHPEELFLTTSWWTTAGTLATVPAHRVVYLLQEDERMFYPHGDRHLRCAEVLARPGPTVVVNTRLLFEHLADSGLPDIAERGLWFEPAFPRTTYFAEASAAASPASAAARRRLFFYARGRHDRNLFTRGIEAVDRAIAEGVIDPARWELHFVGSVIPPLSLSRGVAIHRHENLPWADYARLVRTMDLGLSLMYTPHPSYPPLDLAASGAVVVTNRFGPKRDLSRYSANILCVDTSVEALVAGLAEGVALATDDARRLANLRADHIARDWSRTLAPVLDHIAARHGLAT